MPTLVLSHLLPSLSGTRSLRCLILDFGPASTSILLSADSAACKSSSAQCKQSILSSSSYLDLAVFSCKLFFVVFRPSYGRKVFDRQRTAKPAFQVFPPALSAGASLACLLFIQEKLRFRNH